ncbi:UDP-N-acetylmuramoyl-tripeptide--D-alanyl-D-alanine ligase [Brevibacillus fulvus]|uniref:UDP-N-acetylmuramoyl-tripeptide--D-alanyl-D-alanine ligase n=1 Tax=Brevibacillus fulvus TaxID=1125967 RepID=A0A938Y307_9BACL|nr:UDP-N-acetylmuramoyl-tripeptide--D-alanyl-D-alanine ligase [Brevibacillus fulvus]MBM7590290.1 UDP-N-acetylmuramoyl-tripeptide--D-alanyl-D-alanine ligase [Brevibacillus fulvus]
MKTLYVKEIVENIGGTLLTNREEQPIRHVVVYPHLLRRRSLYFDMARRSKINESKWKQLSDLVIVTDRPAYFLGKNPSWSIIEVEHSHRAYWKFIDYYRSLWEIPVIGVTGTCGKTTVKEMIAHILSKSYRVQSTYKSKNALDRNLQYLLGFDERTDAAVMEMGVARPNDLLKSCRYFKPQIGIITTIGTDHLEHCKTQENYILEKAKLLKGLDNKGTLIINGDDENIKKIDLSKFEGEIIRFGQSEDADYRAMDIRYTEGGMTFILIAYEEKYTAFVPGYGEHNVYNAMASLAAVQEVGMDLEEAIDRLKSFHHVESHLELHIGLNGCTVIDDTWSSNPTSAGAALKVLKEIADGKKTVAVFGRMELLGEQTEQQHALVGEKVARYGIDTLITIDETAAHIGKRAFELGMPLERIYRCKSPRKIFNILKQQLNQQTIVLIKTSMLDSRTKLIKRVLLKERKRR